MRKRLTRSRCQAMGVLMLLAGLGLLLASNQAPHAEQPSSSAAPKKPEVVKPPKVDPKSGRIDLEITQKEPLPADKAAAAMTVPEGFQVVLSAAEPEVRQPIGFTIDDRGRLWVAECYSYPVWQETGHDRILVFEDTDGDGRFDSRKVFWDQGNYLTGLEVGFGGVWACCAPNLYFIPDANGDDVPDGPPQVVLDGWSNKGVHNVLNGLSWGPDGWLYGMNGITAPSKVGKPGASDAERVELNCSVWRYHPTREVFEVVANGTTNPWGLDWDDHGQAFFTNCVISHLFHLVPGGHYERMFGEDINPHSYALIPACSDHLHWGGGKWTDSRGGQGAHSAAGGGHAHAGAMIYLGDQWPASYRNSILMGNIHGKRLNRDTLERHGSGYVGRHAPDFLFANDEWFRGLNFKVGPDGSMWIIDWSDTGECHERDEHGSHHESGRIFKVSYGQPTPAAGLPLANASDEELVQRQLHANDWHVRTARRLLQERAAEGQDLTAAAKQLKQLFASQKDDRQHLRVLWALHVIGAADEAFLREQLAHQSEHVRLWAVRLLAEPSRGGTIAQTPPNPSTSPAVSDELLAKFQDLATNDPSALVRLELASTLQRLPLEQRWDLAAALAAHAEDAADANLPLMIWYGIEPLVPTDKARALRLAAQCKLPVVRQHIARRAVAK